MRVDLIPFGKALIIAGVVGFLIAAVMSFTPYAGLDQGALPATSFFIVMLGLAFAFPTLLEESPGEMSTMRIIVFAVVLLFCTIYLKIGWSIGKLEQLNIDQKWVYILGLAFGSKAFQRLTEKPEGEETSDVKKTKTETISESHESNSGGDPKASGS
jgi:hypothetical protein